MEFDDLMNELEINGNDRSRREYLQQGYPEATHGVEDRVLRRLAKKIGKDHELAGKLWESGVGEAMVLSTMVADPAVAKSRELDGWIKKASWYVLAKAFVTMVRYSPLAQKKCETWRKAADDFIGMIGWMLAAALADHDNPNPDLLWLESLILEIEADIHAANNWTKHGMNLALCCIGGYNRELTGAAMVAAKRIGDVSVDHGCINATTPHAELHLEQLAKRYAKTKRTKMIARQAKRAAKRKAAAKKSAIKKKRS